MPVYKDAKRKSWFVAVTYKDYTGKSIRKFKKGFKTQHEALAWERSFLNKVNGSLEIKFSDFVKVYRENQGLRIKETTSETKDNIIDTKIIPYFGDKTLLTITPTDVMHWQNTMMKAVNPKSGKPYSKAYLKTIHNQLSAIFNHAVKYYHLSENPARIAGTMGTEKEIEMSFWTKEEYMMFAEEEMDRPAYYYAFEVLYWCGLREGELLALTAKDIDLKKGIIDVNKTFAHINGKDIIQSPKTFKSKRKVVMPSFLVNELSEYMDSIYGLDADSRLFPFSKSQMGRELKNGAKRAGVKEIRVHDLRHSHVSLLIDMGYSAVAIGKRVGHESVDITYRYAHLFPTVQDDMATNLSIMKGGED